MNKQLKDLCDELTNEIKESYEKGITLDEAERLAGKFLHAQIKVGENLRAADLDARMKKTGLKAVKASIYMEEVSSVEKKPTEAMLSAKIDLHPLVQKEQDGFDTAEVERESLYNYLQIFKEAHLHFRAISKGRFE